MAVLLFCAGVLSIPSGKRRLVDSPVPFSTFHSTPLPIGTMGLSFSESPLADEDETDGMLATGAVERLANFSRDGIGKPGANRPFFLSTGFHKPHLPHIVPKKYFDLYDIKVPIRN